MQECVELLNIAGDGLERYEQPAANPATSLDRLDHFVMKYVLSLRTTIASWATSRATC